MFSPGEQGFSISGPEFAPELEPDKPAMKLGSTASTDIMTKVKRPKKKLTEEAKKLKRESAQERDKSQTGFSVLGKSFAK